MLRNARRGFSLIEVAIAVVVIGIMTGFALQGKELIHSAKLHAVIGQVNTIKITTQMFVEKYGGLPGTILNASTLFPGTEDGQYVDDFTTIRDAKRFFSHLNASGMISLEMKDGLPVTKAGGVFTVSSNIENYPGVWLVLCNSTDDNKTFSAILSAEDGYMIDKNMETGNPTTGDIIAIKGTNATDDCISNGQYNLKSKSKNCVLLFRLL